MPYEVYCPFVKPPLLIIPEDDPPRYSTKPLKWIRYATFAVLGVEGHLVRYPQEASDADFGLNMEDEAPSAMKLMFHPITSQIKFIDETAYYSNVSDMNRNDERNKRFKDKLVGRDKIGVGFEHSNLRFLEPWYIIPPRKGSRSICKWRNHTGEPDIEDIDDIRNGVLLDVDAPVWFASGQYGILHTPNFSLSVDEVLPPTTKPNLDDTFRFTPHCFTYRRPTTICEDILYDFRYPRVVDGWPVDWPPAFLWDFNYGVGIVKTYGNREAIDVLGNRVKPYYGPSPENHKRESIRHTVRAEIQNHREKMDERTRRHTSGYGEEDQKISDAMDDVLCLSMFFDQHVFEKVEDRPKHGEQRRQAVKKVEAWRTSVGTVISEKP